MTNRRSLLCGAMGASLAGAPAAFARDTVSIALEPYVGRLRAFDLTINGERARLLFDTGAGLTSVTPAFATRLGLAPWGQATGFRASGERVDFQRLANVDIAATGFAARREIFVFDLSRILPEGLPPIDGVAGLDLFEGRTITLAHGLSHLRVERSHRFGRASGRMRVCREAGGAGLTVYVPAASAQGDIWLLLDSANLAGLRLSPPAHAALGAHARVMLSVDGAEPAEAAPDIVAGLIHDGMLDADFIARHDVTIDLARQRIWWRAPGG